MEVMLKCVRMEGDAQVACGSLFEWRVMLKCVRMEGDAQVACGSVAWTSESVGVYIFNICNS